MFIDKPVAASLPDTLAIYAAAKAKGVPIFSASSLRWAGGCVAARAGDFGDVLGCDAFSPCALEETQPDLFWYGIHGVEMLFTTVRSHTICRCLWFVGIESERDSLWIQMGPGCTAVARTSTQVRPQSSSCLWSISLLTNCL